MKKVHYHRGTAVMGETLCGIRAEFDKIVGNGPKQIATCKRCMRKRMKQYESEFESPSLERGT